MAAKFFVWQFMLVTRISVYLVLFPIVHVSPDAKGCRRANNIAKSLELFLCL